MAEPAERSAPAAAPLYALLPPAVRQILLFVGLAAAVAVGVAMALWSQGENYTPLFSGLADRDLGEITAQLDSAKVPYKLDAANGSLLVPADRKYQVRMQLAGSGLPRGAGFGVEEMPERSTFGQTPFMENALYVHAVETELARSIGSMQPVQQARVHLALPPQSAFLRQKREPSASVMLTMYSGRRLDESQVQAVVHLVASSVPDLTPSHVTVVDQSGNLLTGSHDDSASALTNSQFEYRKQLEEEYSQRIQNLVGSIVGPERVRATVAAEVDFTQTEQTRESFDPNVQMVRSEQSSEDTRRGEGVQGVPGALSNQPPQVARPPAAATTTASAETPVSSSKSQVRNFELDKTVSHTRQAVGSIKRLSIGVLVDNKPPAQARGASTPLTEQEIASLTTLVKQAVGFDEMRGDTISVVNSAFQAPAQVAPPPATPMWQNPQIWSIGRQVFGGLLVLAFAYFVLRPMMQILTRPQPIAPAPLTPEFAAQLQPVMVGGRPMALPMGYDDRMAAARSVAGQDPRQVAQVVRSWVAEDNG
ncbi:MAG TPA: flagellar basal-body MS-ring/collar protein FliF [Gammaproteobacteria bacterium]|jgi:flagellar M-ring protein FliF|nr:flagellar basal-body MS-ring/collar protein FliF [Gammaproteobacteria bacterium]